MYTNGNSAGRLRPVDVICIHERDGGITPIRFRLTDDEGILRAYGIKECRKMPINGAYTTADGVYVTQQDVIFLCRIMIRDTMRNIRLYYTPQTGRWQMAG